MIPFIASLLLAFNITLRTSAPMSPRISTPAPNAQVIPLVWIDSAGKQKSFCTAAVIGQDLLLTAAHCVDVAMDTFALINGRLEPMRILFLGVPEGTKDVAILSAKTGNIPPLQIADEAEYPQMCLFIGYAGSLDRSALPCVMLYKSGRDGAIGYGQARGGDSGGPVLGQDGRIIGIVWGRTTSAFIRPEYFYVVPLESIKHAVSQALTQPD